MSDVLIRDIDPAMTRANEERARCHSRDLSDEVKALNQTGLNVPEPAMKMGTWLSSLAPPAYRGDDPVFEYRGLESTLPDFE